MSDAVCKGVKFIGADGVEVTVPIAQNKNGEITLSRDGFLTLLSASAGKRATLDPSALTADRSQALQDASGTIALTSDIAARGLTAYKLADADGDTHFTTDTDPSTDTDLADITAAATLLGRFGSQGGSQAAAWFNVVRLSDDMADTGQSIAMSGSDAFIRFNSNGELHWASGSDPVVDGDLVLTREGAGILGIADDSGAAAQIDVSGLTADRAIVVQDAAGTLALTSDTFGNSDGLSDIDGLTPTDGNVIVGDGSNWVAESGATARTSLGLGAADAVAFASVDVSASVIGLVIDSAPVGTPVSPAAGSVYFSPSTSSLVLVT